MTLFTGPKEFRRVFDLLFATLSRDSKAGPPLRALRKPQRFLITDLGLRLDVRDADEDAARRGDYLCWTWDGKGCSWEPAATLSLESAMANRFFQGKAPLASALIRGEIVVTQGSATVPLETLPHLSGFYKVWVTRLRHEGWEHLVV